MSRCSLPMMYLVAVFITLSSVVMSAPLELNHQGRLLDAVGDPVSGTVELVFRLYDDSSAGTLIWTETHPSVSVDEGLFSVHLGSLTPFDADMFSPPSSGGLPPAQRYLEVVAGGEVITPRLKFVSSPYAVSSHRLSGDVETAPNQIAIGDLDDDGSPDLLLVSDLTSSRLAIQTKGTGANRTGITLESSGGETTEIRAIGDLNGDGFPEIAVSSYVTPDSGSISLQSYDNGQPEQEISSSVVPTKSQHAINTKGTGAQNGRVVAIQSETTVDSARQSILIDDDGDGNAEVKKTENVRFQLGSLAVDDELLVDSNGDGNPESSSLTLVTADSSGNWLDNDSDDDGLSDVEDSRVVSRSGAKSKLVWSPQSNLMVNEAEISVDSSSSTVSNRMDVDGDGFPEQEISSSVVPTKSQHAINTKGTGAQNGRVVAIKSETSVDSAMQVVHIDDDGDGFPESDASTIITPTTSSLAIQTKGTGANRFRGGGDCDDADVRWYVDNDDDGDDIPDHEVAMKVTPTSSSVAIKTKGTGADKDRSAITSETNDSMAVIISSLDPNDDGFPDIAVSGACTIDSFYREAVYSYPNSSAPSMQMKAKEKANKQKCANNLRQFGLGRESSTEFSVDSAGTASLELHSTGTNPGDGVSYSVHQCTPDSVVKEATYEFTNAMLLPALMKAKEKANKTKCSNGLRQQSPVSETETEFSCDSADARMFWMANDFSGSISSVTIQASVNSALNPIEHSSGAHLTPGGTWTNSSDENLKENFQPVDGEQLLEQIESLPISEWNYKTESDDIRHIGPTAQDFQKIFGVGSNGKTISTIDPSGIALAAIKALNEKSKKIDQLESRIEELTKLVEKLAKEQK